MAAGVSVSAAIGVYVAANVRQARVAARGISKSCGAMAVMAALA
jgi:hypothetical protein